MNEQTVAQFMAEYLEGDLIARLSWMGLSTYKTPCDLWVYAELIHELRPERVIECGTWEGANAHWLATVLETTGRGNVLSVDVGLQADLPTHPRLSYLQGNSVAASTLDAVREFLGTHMAGIVILDSDHHAEHVRIELDAYSAFVKSGGYLVVEDTHINRPHPIPGIADGPGEALDQWLPQHPEFEVDLNRERFGLTVCKGGYLRRR